MTTFKDKAGREWAISLTIGRARAVLEKTGVDLLQPEMGAKKLPEILTDEYRVAEVIGVLLSSEFKRHNVDPENMFEEDWDGTTSQSAYKALLEELTSFFEARGQPARAALVRKTWEAVQEAMKIMEERAAMMNPAKAVRDLMAANGPAIAGSTSGKPQDAPDSTQKV